MLKVSQCNRKDIRYSLQDSVHAVDKAWIARNSDTRRDGTLLGVASAVPVKRVIFDTGVDQGEDDGDKHAECRNCSHSRDMVECSGQGEND
jgi:hypothetical protein